MLPLIVFGTHNRKKGVELAEVFAPVGIDVKTLAEMPSAIAVDETGTTFAANARLKAVEQAKHLRLWVLGEDSGLAVDALDGAPGVYSARYSELCTSQPAADQSREATDAANNRLLLERLAELPLERRTARYVCHMVLSDPAGEVRAESEGDCRGRIVFAPRGQGGFGYDPLFEVTEYHRTFGELSPQVKACLSHRARAARQLIPQVRRLFGVR